MRRVSPASWYMFAAVVLLGLQACSADVVPGAGPGADSETGVTWGSNRLDEAAGNSGGQASGPAEGQAQSVVPDAFLRTTLDRIDAEAAIDAVFDVIVGRVYEEHLVSIHQFAQNVSPASVDYLYRGDRDLYEQSGYECPDGGEAIRYHRVEDDGSYSNDQFDFDDCGAGGHRYDGTAVEFITAYGDARLEFDALTVSGVGGRRLELQGAMSRTLLDDGDVDGAGSSTFSVEDVSAGVTEAGYQYALEKATTRFHTGLLCPRNYGCYETAYFSASFTLRDSTVASGREFTVETPTAFGNDSGSDLRFDRGMLEIITDDGGFITLEADNGDSSSATLSVTQPDGDTVSFELLWSDLQESLRYLP